MRKTNSGHHLVENVQTILVAWLVGIFFGQVMYPKLSDQMFQRSQVSGVALCMSKVKVRDSVSESVSE